MTFDYFSTKLGRISGWLLLVVILIYMASGYALCNDFGLGWLMSPGPALWLHKAMNWPLIVLMAGHVVPSIYLAFRRSRWSRKKSKD